MIKNHPVFGVGLNNFLVELPKYQKINSYQDLQPVHNIYLLIMAEGGIAGFSIFVWILGKAYLQISNFKFLISKQTPNIKSQIKARSLDIGNSLDLPAQAGIRLIRIIRNSLLISFSSILLLSLFDHYFHTIHQTQLLSAVILGFIFSFKKAKMDV